VTPVDMEVTPGPAQTVVKVVGEVDLSNVEQFRRTLFSTVDQPVVVDLSGVDYIDSSGIAALFGRAAAGRLEIICPPEGPVRALVEVTRLGRVAEIREV
jgi:anti-sigma B factor antagonist